MPQARTLVGRRVKLSGLVSKPELNGCTGRVMSLDERSGRASVRLAGSVKSLDAAPQIVSVRPLNLTPISEEPLPEDSPLWRNNRDRLARLAAAVDVPGRECGTLLELIEAAFND